MQMVDASVIPPKPQQVWRNRRTDKRAVVMTVDVENRTVTKTHTGLDPAGNVRTYVRTCTWDNLVTAYELCR